MKKGKTKGIRMELDLVDKIQDLADRDRRSFSDYVRLVLKEHIKLKEHEILWQKQKDDFG